MNEILNAIYTRRAVRKYKDLPVRRNVINQLLDAGRMAPSAINRQPWEFYILDNKEDIQFFSQEIVREGMKSIPHMGLKKAAKAVVTGITNLAHGIDFIMEKDPVFHGAPVVIFITAPKDNEWAQLDIGMCAQNIMLAAKSLGLDSCPVGFGKYIEKSEYYSKFNIPDDEQVLLSVIIGYGDESPEVHKRKLHNAFYYDVPVARD